MIGYLGCGQFYIFSLCTPCLVMSMANFHWRGNKVKRTLLIYSIIFLLSFWLTVETYQGHLTLWSPVWVGMEVIAFNMIKNLCFLSELELMKTCCMVLYCIHINHMSSLDSEQRKSYWVGNVWEYPRLYMRIQINTHICRSHQSVKWGHITREQLLTDGDVTVYMCVGIISHFQGGETWKICHQC